MGGENLSHLPMQELSPASIILRLSSIRRLARGMAEHQHFCPRPGPPLGERLPEVSDGTSGRELADLIAGYEWLNVYDPRTFVGRPDRGILALWIICGLRRAAMVRLSIEHIR